ncbi:hypothetical protein [Hyalangium versicolor]|uniref:hypothetical protein n=1 Tax=Hyalangium versicolor TaxID=2861190 RepID=UPI001CC978AE|nr:hypothetical protein [Hyalangium versicolor]
MAETLNDRVAESPASFVAVTEMATWPPEGTHSGAVHVTSLEALVLAGLPSFPTLAVHSNRSGLF